MFKFLRKPSPNGYVIDQFSLGVSLFPKTGSTSFKHFLFEAEHGRAFKNQKENKHIHNWAKKNRIAPLKDCKFRLILIRDPIERFISCYNNKVIQARLLDNRDIGPLSLANAEREFPYPSFDEFVDNFPEIRKLPVFNHHTKPISEFLGTRNLDFFTEVFTFDQIDNLAERINQITNNEIDEIYNKGMNAGAIGGKLLGAGGGGFMLFYADKQYHEEIKSALEDKLFVPFRFEKTGSQIIYFSHD